MLLFVVVVGVLLPEIAWAWGPSAHLSFGLELIGNLSLLPRDLQSLIAVYQQQFLYGSISADITLGKKFFVDYRHHCHNWKVGMDLLRETKTDSMRAFVLGYLCHLAADTVAHNLFVPTKIVEAHKWPHKGHLYWELVYDRHLIDQHILDMFYSLSQNPFVEEDQFLRRSLKPTLFSFATNKRIFNGLLVLQRLNQWQRLMDRTLERSTDGLAEDEVRQYFQSSVNAMISFLIDREDSKFYRLDPTGEGALNKSRSYSRALRKGKSALSLRQSLTEIEQSFNSGLAGV